ncbi:lysophosphatidic acid receptor 6 [Electrophorus electricus]|uniref:Si:dkey-3k24.8 n=1 Tax=Electrophorus electricus TaxID=8005 RepID=A0A4W4FK90_ELEEL|nr:lysophosphatidic acid receptor 6 [Electrophorus electricus]
MTNINTASLESSLAKIFFSIQEASCGHQPKRGIMRLNSTTLDGLVALCLNQTQGQINVTFIVVYALVFVTGLALNLIALVVFFCLTELRSQTTVYMTNLALADLLLVCTLPFRILHHWGFGLSQMTCEVVGLILLVNMYGSIFLLTCISLDRCMAVCFPLSSQVREGRKKARLVCLGVWMLTIGASLPMYLSKIKMIKNNTENCFGGFPHYAIQTTALTSSLTIGFGLPLVIMGLSSWSLVKAIRKSTAVQTTDLFDSHKIQRMVGINLTIFLFCFLPYHLMLVVQHFYINHKKSLPCSVLSAHHNSLMVACMNATLNPVTYYFTKETFRKNVDIDAVRRMWPMNSHSSDGNTPCRRPLST